MGLLDGLFNGLGKLIDLLADIVTAVTDPDIGDTDIGETIGDLIVNGTVLDDVGTALVDTLEQTITADLRDEGQITPGNAPGVSNETEGNAAAVLAGLGASASALEAASLGQIDQHTEYITQAVIGLGFDDVTGMELDARVKEGLMPALEAEANRQHTSKFVDLQDAIELLLRNKQSDTLYLAGDSADDVAQNLVQLPDPVDEANILEHYGLREDQLPILERVAINGMEFEELIEQPAELGLKVPDAILNAELDRAGYSEATKDFLQQVNNEIVNTTRFYEELTAVAPVIEKLDQFVESGYFSATEAESRLPPEVSDAQPALRKRFTRIEALPPGRPTQAQLVDSFARGEISREQLEDELQESEFDTDRFPGVVESIILDELDGDLQESLALGLVSENRFSQLCDFVGLDQDATNLLLAGQSFSDITKRRLQEEQDPSELPVTAIQGIGEARSSSLEVEGITTVAQLAAAGVSNVADITQVSESTAEGWISQAQQLVN
jgi:hypothetical protein